MSVYGDLLEERKKKALEVVGHEESRMARDTVGAAIQYILSEGNHYSDSDTLSIVRALNILHRQLDEVYLANVSLADERRRMAATPGFKVAGEPVHHHDQ